MEAVGDQRRAIIVLGELAMIVIQKNRTRKFYTLRGKNNWNCIFHIYRINYRLFWEDYMKSDYIIVESNEKMRALPLYSMITNLKSCKKD